MKKVVHVLLLIFSLFSLTACGQGTSGISEEEKQLLAEKSKSYSDEDYQNGKVPAHSYVCISGEIQRTDEKTGIVKKESRFILKTDQSRYQVINGKQTGFKVGDYITVYGEYYGFIKAINIEEK